MPDRIARAARKATSLDDGTGPSAEPLNLASDSVPDVLTRLLKALGLDDALGVGAGSQVDTAKMPATGTKPLNELIGEIFTPASKTGPRRLRFTSTDPETGTGMFHSLDKPYTPMKASLDEIAGLIKSGEIVPHGPAELSVPALLTKLQSVMKSAGPVARRLK